MPPKPTELQTLIYQSSAKSQFRLNIDPLTVGIDRIVIVVRSIVSSENMSDKNSQDTGFGKLFTNSKLIYVITFEV